jgi:hypothetical protein
MRLFRAILAALAAATSLAAGATNFSDLWWNPQESGWGANIVQQGERAFVTLFVHGPDGEPTWLVAPDVSIYAYGAQGLPHFRGTLYRVRGSWLGGVFDPANTRATPVGLLYVSPQSRSTILLDYSVDGLEVRKTLTRQTWSSPQAAFWYTGKFYLREAWPSGPAYGAVDYEADILFHFHGGELVMKVERAGAVDCLYRGPALQSGRLVDASGSFSCDDGSSGDFQVTGLEFTEHGVAGYLRTTRPDRVQYGRFGAARY